METLLVVLAFASMAIGIVLSLALLAVGVYQLVTDRHVRMGPVAGRGSAPRFAGGVYVGAAAIAMVLYAVPTPLPILIDTLAPFALVASAVLLLVASLIPRRGRGPVRPRPDTATARPLGPGRRSGGQDS